MRHDWSSGVAACIGVDPNVFFIDTKDLRLVRRAKAYCDYCPCRRPCLEWAYENGVQGIWGGTTDGEREFAYLLLKAIVANPAALKFNDDATHLGDTFDFSLDKTLDEKLHRPDVQDHHDDSSCTTSPYIRNPQAYKLAVAIRILRRERERVLEAYRCSA